MIINSLREYGKNFTESEVFVNGEKFCHVLEDEGRPAGVKIYAETCIPEGHYSVQITMSGRFKKPMMVVYNKPDRSVERSGVRFTGIRVHSGYNVEHTAGCLLAMYKTDNGEASNPASNDLQALVQAALDQGEEVHWIISRKN